MKGNEPSQIIAGQYRQT